MPTSRATVRHLVGEGGQRVDHVVDRVGQLRDLALGLEHQLALEVAVGDRGDDPGDAAHLVVRLAAMKLTLSVRSFHVPATPLHLGLAAELALGADFARHAGHFGGEGVELIDHRVDGVLQLEDLAA